MRNYKVYINGQLVSAERASISVFDSAFLYGEGLFETLIAINGSVPFLADHFKRLYRGARALGIPMALSPEDLERALYQTLRANRLRDAYIRVNISAEEADVGLRSRSPAETHVVIFTKPATPYPKRLYQQGAHLIVVRNIVNDPISVATIKTTNYLIKMLARREIQSRKADEGILLNSKGQITECAGSNLFVVKNDRLITPPVADGLMPGVTRKWVLYVARKQKIICQEKSLRLAAVASADEIFITSTLKAVMPVARVGRQRLRGGIPGPITQRLMQAYRERLAMNLSK